MRGSGLYIREPALLGHASGTVNQQDNSLTLSNASRVEYDGWRRCSRRRILGQVWWSIQSPLSFNFRHRLPAGVAVIGCGLRSVICLIGVCTRQWFIMITIDAELVDAVGVC